LIGYVAAGVATAGGLLALDRLANSVMSTTPVQPEVHVPDLGIDHEDLRIGSAGQELAAWLLKPRSPRERAPLLLLAHGWGASYGTVLQLARPLVSGGYEVLLFDARGHGRNAPAPFVNVGHFRDDTLSVVAYVRERFPGRRLVLVGHSLGGAGAVLAAAEGARIDGLVLIAAPSDVLRITSEYLTDHGKPGPFMVAMLMPFLRRRMRGSFRSHTPVARISEVRVPMLIIQPEHDRRVARYHAELLSEAAGVPYHLVPDREHTDVLAAPMTERLLEEFLAGL